jgi:hypothetical protein
MAPPSPGPSHNQLARLAGHWSGTERMPPSQWVSREVVAAADVRASVVAGGFVLSWRYAQYQGNREVYSGQGVLWIDPETDGVALDWWDSMGGAHQRFTGEWEGDTLTLRSETPRGHSRATWTLDGDRLTRVLEVSPEGATWAVGMTGTYTRG